MNSPDIQLSRRRGKPSRPSNLPRPFTSVPATAEGEAFEEKSSAQVKIILQRLVSTSREDAIEALEFLCLSFAGRPEFGNLLLEIRYMMIDITRLEWDEAATKEVMQKVFLWAQSLPM
jgi:hypothetical protein